MELEDDCSAEFCIYDCEMNTNHEILLGLSAKIKSFISRLNDLTQTILFTNNFVYKQALITVDQNFKYSTISQFI